MLGYKIGKGVLVGNSFILCEDAVLEENSIVRSNNFILCRSLYIGSNTKINSGNTITGNSSFSIGENSRIINDHFFDVSSNISIGDNTWIAGKGSQFWTHGSIHTKNNKDLSIVLGDEVYIGSRVSMAPGVSIGNINLIGLGSVLSKSFVQEQTIIAGNPAVVVKRNIDWRQNW